MNNCDITLILEYGLINNKSFDVELTHNGVTTPITGTTHTVSVNLPTQIMVKFSGKNMATDTIIDDTGRIVADKYVKIKEILLDNIQLPRYFLEKKLELVDENNVIRNTNYIGFNGCLVLNFEKSNVFSQYYYFDTLGKQ